MWRKTKANTKDASSGVTADSVIVCLNGLEAACRLNLLLQFPLTLDLETYKKVISFPESSSMKNCILYSSLNTSPIDRFLLDNNKVVLPKKNKTPVQKTATPMLVGQSFVSVTVVNSLVSNQRWPFVSVRKHHLYRMQRKEGILKKKTLKEGIISAEFLKSCII